MTNTDSPVDTHQLSVRLAAMIRTGIAGLKNRVLADPNEEGATVSLDDSLGQYDLAVEVELTKTGQTTLTALVALDELTTGTKCWHTYAEGGLVFSEYAGSYGGYSLHISGKTRLRPSSGESSPAARQATWFDDQDKRNELLSHFAEDPTLRARHLAEFILSTSKLATALEQAVAMCSRPRSDASWKTAIEHLEAEINRRYRELFGRDLER